MRILKLNLLLALSCIYLSPSINAQTPMACDGRFFVSHANSIFYLDSTYVDLITFSHGATFQTPFGNSGTIGLNAIGFNPIDGFIYGLRYPLPITQPELIRIDAAGNFFDLGAITGDYPIGNSALSGCFDIAGNYYTSDDPGPGNVSNLYKVDISTNVSTIVGSTNLVPQSGGDIFFVDMAVNAETGNLYGVSSYCCGENGSNSSALYQIDKATGSSTLISQIFPVGAYFGMFFNDFGQLFVYRSDGNLYQVDLSTGVATFVGSGISYNFADACSCNFRVSNLLSANATCAGVNSATVALQVVLKNYSPVDQAGLSYSLTLPDVFQFTQSAVSIQSALTPLYGAVSVNISSANAGTNNRIDITNMDVAVNNVITPSTTFTLNALANDLSVLNYPVSASLSGLPLLLGTNESSDDPSTLDANDSTVIQLPSTCIVLPIKLLQFDVLRQGNTALVSWATTSEINSSYFEIERSADGKDWSSIGKVQATNNNSQNQYSFSDASPLNGNNYYRLEQVDNDGSTQYSPTKILKFGSDDDEITVFPNPSNAFFDLSKNSGDIAQYEIADASGKIIRKGLLSDKVEIQGLTPGVYIASVYTQAGTKIAKIVVQ
jgi:hypothetical protein